MVLVDEAILSITRQLSYISSTVGVHLSKLRDTPAARFYRCFSFFFFSFSYPREDGGN